MVRHGFKLRIAAILRVRVVGHSHSMDDITVMHQREVSCYA